MGANKSFESIINQFYNDENIQNDASAFDLSEFDSDISGILANPLDNSLLDEDMNLTTTQVGNDLIDNIVNADADVNFFSLMLTEPLDTYNTVGAALPIIEINEQKSQTAPVVPIPVTEEVKERGNRPSSHQALKNSFCKACGNRFSSVAGKKAHILEKHKSGQFQCDQCADVLKTAENLLRHKMVHTNQDASWACQFCFGKFKSNKSLSLHLSNVHDFSARKTKKIALAQDSSIIRKRRKKNPMELKSVNCVQCAKVFHSSSNLKRHMQNIHMNIRSYECEDCRLKFATKYNRDMHLYRIHRR